MLINILDARNQLSRLIKAARAGEDVVIANRGEPVARIVRAEREPDRLGNGADLVAWLDAHPLPARRPRPTAAQAEAEIQSLRDAWD